MTAKPTTAAEANKLLSQLEAKRATLNGTIASSAERRSAAAVAAEFGDEAAKETLRKVTAEATEAKDALQNIDAVIAEIRTLRDELTQDEATAREIATAAAVDEAIDAVLVKSDEVDAKLQEARDLMAELEELERAPILRQARINKSAGSLTIRSRELATTLLGFFDRQLSHLSGAGEGYLSLTRCADWSSKYWGKKSPAQIERGNRPLSPFERTWKASVDRVGWAGNLGSGHDSQLLSDEFRAKGGRKAVAGRPVVDVSGGWDGDKGNPGYSHG